MSSHARIPSDIAILGGGLTGLMTAVRLSELLPNARLTVYEALDRLGGWIQTTRADAPNGRPIILEQGPRLVRIPGPVDPNGDIWGFAHLAKHALSDRGSEMAFYGSETRLPRWVYYPDHLVALPDSVKELFKCIILNEPLLSPLLKEAWRIARPARPGSLLKHHDDPYWDQSIGDFFDSIFGPNSSMSVLASSLVAGIYGGDPYQLSALHASPFATITPRYYNMREMGLVKFFLRKHFVFAERDFRFLQSMFEEEGTQAVPSFAGHNVVFPLGTGSIIESLVTVLSKKPQVTIKTGARVRALRRDQGNDRVVVSTMQGCERSHEKVISTIFSRHLAAVTTDAETSQTLLPSLAETEAVNILAVNLWYPNPTLQSRYPGFGYLASPLHVAREQNPDMALGVLFDTWINPVQHQQEGGSKFTILFGGHHWRGIPVDQLPDDAKDAEMMGRRTLDRHMGIPLGEEPGVVAHKLCVECIPQHLVGHRARMARAHNEILSAYGEGLAVAGPSYTRPGVVGALRAAMETAHAVAAREACRDPLGTTGLAHFEGHERKVSISRKKWMEIEKVRLKTVLHQNMQAGEMSLKGRGSV